VTALATRLTLERLVEVVDMRVSDEQAAVVTAPLEAGVVVAGAGSGKTATMVARVAWLVGTGQVSPDQVLGLTFTTKAADELAVRVRLGLRRLRAAGLLPTPAGRPGPARRSTVTVRRRRARAHVSTYHAFAGRWSVTTRCGWAASRAPADHPGDELAAGLPGRRLVRRADGGGGLGGVHRRAGGAVAGR
jgi:hypothetical protein